MDNQNKIYIPPYELDDKLYPVGFLTKNEENPIEVKFLKRNEFPSSIIGNHFNKLLNKGHIDNFHCFYTGVNCWLGKFSNDDLRGEKARYRLSKEHLSSLKIADTLGLLGEAHNSSNLIGVAAYINYNIGHIPLVLKLWMKKHLKECDYSRNEMTIENSRKILGHIIYLQQLFTFKELYPWQPSTYLDKNDQKISEAIFNEMIQVDKEFLLIKSVKESFQWLKEYNPDWIEKILTNDFKTRKSKIML